MGVGGGHEHEVRERVETSHPAETAERDRPTRVAVDPSSALALQRLAGNAAVAGLIVQRRVAHTAAARVPRILASDPVVAAHAGQGGGPAPTVRVHALAAFRREYVAYAVRNGQGEREAAAHATFVSGFTDLDAGVVHLNRDRGDPGTLVHEALHLRSSRAFVESVHRKVNEGITEFFTRRVCAAARVARGSDSYPQEHAAIERLVQLSSPEAVATAYFTNRDAALDAALEARRPGLWLDWRIAMTRRISDANALLDELSSGAGGTVRPGAGTPAAGTTVSGAQAPTRLQSPAAPAR